MSIVNALQNGTKTFKESNANVCINLGYGNANIDVTAKNAAISTKCGNHNINVNTTGNAYVKTGCCGEDNVNAKVGGDAIIITGSDDDVVQLEVGGNFYVDAGAETCCPCESDNDTVLIKGNLDNKSGCNYVGLGDGTDNTRIIANNVTVNKGNGTNILGFYGDNYDVQSCAENNIVGFWGDNVNMNFKNSTGIQDIKTLDFSFEAGQFTDFGFEDLLEQETYDKTTVETKVEYALTGKNNIAEATKKYNLTCEQQAQLQNLDLTKTTSNGQPYYVIYNNGSSNQIGYRDNANNIYDLNGNKQTYSTTTSNTTSTTSSSTTQSKVCFNDEYDKTRAYGNRHQSGYYTYDNTTTTTNYTTKYTQNTAKYANNENINVEQEKEKITTTTTTDYYNIDGVKNVNINFGKNGDYNVGITASDGFVNINGKDVTEQDAYQNILVRSGYVLTNSTVDVQKEKFMEKINLSAGNINYSSNSWNKNWSTSSTSSVLTGRVVTKHWSPLILDTNNDGKVSATAGIGVDINGDGTVDGAATDGDKMLAMSDMNNNGTIDGTEVFGNNTVSPFTGKALNAANGFEALKMIAEEAEALGYECIENGEVDVQALADILEGYGIKLGFISDTNNTEVEDLSGVKTINVDNYEEANETGDIQHRQQGSFTWLNGTQGKVDDVWFKAQ